MERELEAVLLWVAEPAVERELGAVLLWLLEPGPHGVKNVL